MVRKPRAMNGDYCRGIYSGCCATIFAGTSCEPCDRIARGLSTVEEEMKRKNNVVSMPRKARPLRATYRPDAPYEVERRDAEDDSINYEIVDRRPGSYRIVCFVSDDEGRNGYAKWDAEQIARSLNLMVNLGKETLPNVRDGKDE